MSIIVYFNSLCGEPKIPKNNNFVTTLYQMQTSMRIIVYFNSLCGEPKIPKNNNFVTTLYQMQTLTQFRPFTSQLEVQSACTWGGMDAKRTRRRRRDVSKPDGPRQRKKREPKWKATVREIEEVGALYESLNPSKVAQFSNLPLSTATRDGLAASGYTNPTDIQKEAIPLALRGKDVLGAAKTGSGKTLAFLVPLLEVLWRERWSPMDGLGALVISPTRELAYQTFEVLRKVGSCHDFSAGLVTGGKDIAMEQDRIQKTNIVICTPGRLLQHMDETVNFDCSSLKMLVLDEADRILDLGFQHAVNAIIQNLPAQRQTLLFSATQTRSVRDLARLSLVEPEYVAVHENSRHSTPHKLTQSYLVCDLQDKLNVLFSFMRNHLTCKMIVFISSCKQVKFVYEVFRRMRPGIPLMALYGRQKHVKRMAIYTDFCQKKASVLFCTDIAARGLDIPAVDWVLQMDCPEDANTYIHRAGRTARYESGGKSLLFLLPSEEHGMLEELKRKKIPIECIQVNPRKISSIQRKLESFCAQDCEVKQWAQRSFICYLRSVHLQSNKRIFDVHKLSLEQYAASLGLLRPPRVRFMQKLAKKDAGERAEEEEEEASREGSGLSEEEEEDSSSDVEEDGDQILFVKR